MLIPNRTQESNFPKQTLGMVLIAAGGLWLIAQITQVDIGENLWPLFVILPGCFILAVSHMTGLGEEKLSIAGCVVLAVGMLLLYQNTFSHFESWAYAWALVLPGAGGFGLLLNSAKQDNENQARIGRRLIVASGAIFVVGAVFFELIVNISGLGIRGLGVNSYLWPALSIAAGMFAIRRKKQPRHS